MLMPAELKASQPCCKNGKLSTCPDLANGLSYDISSCTSAMPVDPVEPVFPVDPELGEAELAKDCTSGQVQYKPSGECGTSERTCCSNRIWSAWDGECSGSSLCSSSQCWNGSKCENKGVVSRPCSGNVTGATGGTQTRTATCTKGSGWSYGNWSSNTCVYDLGGGGACNCGANEHMVRYPNGNCCCENNTCGTILPSGNKGYCKCLNYDIQL